MRKRTPPPQCCRLPCPSPLCRREQRSPPPASTASNRNFLPIALVLLPVLAESDTQRRAQSLRADRTGRAHGICANATPTISGTQLDPAAARTSRPSHRSSCFAENSRQAAESLPARLTRATAFRSDPWPAVRLHS